MTQNRRASVCLYSHFVFPLVRYAHDKGQGSYLPAQNRRGDNDKVRVERSGNGRYHLYISNFMVFGSLDHINQLKDIKSRYKGLGQS